MLTQKQQDLPYIHVFKLSSGEEVIATVIEELTDSFRIKSPLQLTMGAQGLSFAPFSIMGDPQKSMLLNRSLVTVHVSPAPKIESQYQSITTGIALPEKSSIIV